MIVVDEARFCLTMAIAILNMCDWTAIDQLRPVPLCAGLIADGADDAASSADWGAAALTEALRTVVADVGRLQNLLPELSPRDRWAGGVLVPA